MPVFLSEEELRTKAKALEDHRALLFKTKYLPRVRAFPRVRALFEQLNREGKQLVLASSAQSDEIGAYERIAGITDLVDQVISADDVAKSKPHPDVFEAAMGRLPDITPAEAIVVGDSPYDAEAADKAGLETIGVLCGGFAEAELREAGCLAVFDDLHDLLLQYESVES